MDPAKVRAVYDWPVPGSRNTLQRILDFANFYGRFIKKIQPGGGSSLSINFHQNQIQLV